MSLLQRVRTHLVHYNLWTDVTEHSANGLVVLSGRPPHKLDEQDGSEQREWVVPCSMNEAEVTLEQIDAWFECAAAGAARPRRMTVAVANDDGTIVYYFVHDGVAKPRQN